MRVSFVDGSFTGTDKADTLFGKAGNDYLSGDDGNDILDGGRITADFAAANDDKLARAA
jgi:Ca2+-binding RTX toxin-like protein